MGFTVIQWGLDKQLSSKNGDFTRSSSDLQFAMAWMAIWFDDLRMTFPFLKTLASTQLRQWPKG